MAGYSACLTSFTSSIRFSLHAYGYLKDRGDGRLSVYPAFLELVENYAGLYFAYVTHYINVVPKERRHPNNVTLTV